MGKHRPLNSHSFSPENQRWQKIVHIFCSAQAFHVLNCAAVPIFSTHCSRFFFIQDTGLNQLGGLTVSPLHRVEAQQIVHSIFSGMGYDSWQLKWPRFQGAVSWRLQLTLSHSQMVVFAYSPRLKGCYPSAALIFWGTHGYILGWICWTDLPALKANDKICRRFWCQLVCTQKKNGAGKSQAKAR